MGAAAGASLNLNLAEQPYHIAGPQYLIILWVVEGTAGNYVKSHTIILKINQTTRFNNNHQIRSDRYQESVLEDSLPVLHQVNSPTLSKRTFQHLLLFYFIMECCHCKLWEACYRHQRGPGPVSAPCDLIGGNSSSSGNLPPAELNNTGSKP